MAQGEMFPEKCWRGGCRNKVRVYIPEDNAPRKTTPSCVKHADAYQRKVLYDNRLLVWAMTRAPGEPDA